MSDVVVLGSVNLDRVQTVARLPEPGDTVHGRSFATYHGGKGANQAVAAARMGASVRFVGRVGRDEAGAALRAALVAEGIDDASLLSVDGPTGFATILVSAAGENVIVLEAGANGRFAAATLEPDDLAGAKVALFQTEVPVETVARGLERGHAAVGRGDRVRGRGGCTVRDAGGRTGVDPEAGGRGGVLGAAVTGPSGAEHLAMGRTR